MSRTDIKHATFQKYLQQHGLKFAAGEQWPDPPGLLKLCVVIPCLAEYERLPQVLASLCVGSRRLAETEVIVVVNQAETAGPEITANNQQTWDLLASLEISPLRVLAMDRFSAHRAFAAKAAGVGLARRTGMDLAYQRLLQAGNLERSAMACLDADSPVAPGYVDELLAEFDSARPPAAGVCAYEHPRPADPVLQNAMIAYELWLRYFSLGFHVSGSRYTFPAIGSCLVVSAMSYAQVHGMAERKATEDFHFMQKLVKLSLPSPVARLKAKVFPEARLSSRVLLGTGQGMEKCLEQGAEHYLWVEPPEYFLDFKEFFKLLAGSYHNPESLVSAVNPRLRDFLSQEHAWEIIKKQRQNYKTETQYETAVQRWLDGLRLIRYVNQQTRQTGKVWILDAFRRLLDNCQNQDLLPYLPAMSSENPDWEALHHWLEQLRCFEWWNE